MYIFSDMILDQQVGSGQLSEDVRHRVHEALLKQHHHQNQKKLSNRIPIVRSFADIGKKQSEPHSMDKNGNVLLYFAFWAFNNICLFSTTCAWNHSLNSVWLCSEKALCKSGTFYMSGSSYAFCLNLEFRCPAQFRAVLFKGRRSGVGSRVTVFVRYSALINCHGTLSLAQHSSRTLVVL